MSKGLAEKLWIQANIGKHRARFASCRYGNVLGSHGSVIEKWTRQRNEGKRITVINGGMTRFFITPHDAAEFVVSSMNLMNGGEVFIPKMRSCEITELADVFSLGIEQEMISARPGEKKHEKLVADAEVGLVTDIGDRLVRWPEWNLYPVKKYGTPIEKVYTSETAERFNREKLCQLIST